MKTRIILLFFAIALGATAQNKEHAFEVNKRLGRGINFGNMFEAESENAWGNPWEPEYSGIVSELGFNHIRLPIRWEPSARSSSVAPYTINPTFLKRIKQVVDSALANGLQIIINMHHHEALYDNPDGQKARFLAQWEQISEYFKDYPDSLLFEVMNEPHGNLNPAKWNELFSDALTTIRETNPTRVVLMGTAEYGGLGGLSKLELPEDDNIIVTVHYYNPFHFTHQGASWVGDGKEADAWLGTTWNDSETERQVIRQDFAALKAFENKHNVPVHIGEFGAYSKADIKSRAKWTTFIARHLETLNWSWAYWEFSAGFGIYDKNRKTYNRELVDALLHNEMPEPAKYVGVPLYTSDFKFNNNGWNFTRHQGSASFSRQDGALKVDITDGSTENWHLQLVRNNFRIEEGKEYRLSFKAKGAANRNATVYMGMTSSPWSAYSGYVGFAVADTFSTYTIVFKSAVTDSKARIVFDIGNSNEDFYVTDIKFEEIYIQWPTNVESFSGYETSIYPNPASDVITINNLDNFQSFAIINMQGALIKSKSLYQNLNQIEINDLPPGLYIVKLKGENKTISHKIIKK